MLLNHEQYNAKLLSDSGDIASRSIQLRCRGQVASPLLEQRINIQSQILPHLFFALKPRDLRRPEVYNRYHETTPSHPRLYHFITLPLTYIRRDRFTCGMLRLKGRYVRMKKPGAYPSPSAVRSTRLLAQSYGFDPVTDCSQTCTLKPFVRQCRKRVPSRRRKPRTSGFA
jgi:hypothetical protein